MLKLEEIISRKLIPWSKENLTSRIVVARHKMEQLQMPSGVRLDYRPIPSQRVPVRNKRVYNNVRNVIAAWPDAHMNELGKYALICVFDGFINYPLSHYKLRCGEGHFIFVPPGIPWSDGTESYVDLTQSQTCDLAVFCLHPGALEMWTSHGHSGGRKQDNNYLISRQFTINLFEVLIDEVINEQESKPPLVRDLMGAFFEMVLRNLHRKDYQYVNYTQSMVDGISRIKPDDFPARLEEYVLANLQQPLKLRAVAFDMYLSPAQFCREMRRETGMSFVEYLTEKRLQKARTLLIESSWSIKAIAKLCGFSSLEYFSVVFKKSHSKTPSRYRQEHKGS